MRRPIRIAMVLMGVLLYVIGPGVGSEGFPLLRGPYLGQTPPGVTPELFAPGIISHGFHENGIVFSPDGKECLFSFCDRSYRHKIFAGLVETERGWTSPTVASFTGGSYTHSVIYSRDGSTLYFSSRRPLSPGGPDKPDLDVWRVEKKGRSWGPPVRLPGPLNTDNNEQITSLAANGTLYLRTDHQGRGHWAIYRARLSENGYAAAEKLGETINAGYNEGNPCVSPDERFLLFKSSRPGGFGGTDLYVSFRRPDGSWGPPLNLGSAINSADDELEPRLSPDGRYLFFTSFRQSDPAMLRSTSYQELTALYRHPQNGYGTLYWVRAEIIDVLADRSSPGRKGNL